MRQDGAVPDLDVGPSSRERGPGLSRRTFLKAGLGGSQLIAAGSKWMPLSKAQDEVLSEYVLIIDLNSCTGCGACEVACPVKPQRAIVVVPLPA